MFTKEELSLLSEGVLAIIERVSRSRKLCEGNKIVCEGLDDFLGTLHSLNDKVCDMMEVVE